MIGSSRLEFFPAYRFKVKSTMSAYLSGTFRNGIRFPSDADSPCARSWSSWSTGSASFGKLLFTEGCSTSVTVWSPDGLCSVADSDTVDQTLSSPRVVSGCLSIRFGSALTVDRPNHNMHRTVAAAVAMTIINVPKTLLMPGDRRRSRRSSSDLSNVRSVISYYVLYIIIIIITFLYFKKY